jgi:hypothetical protein
MYFFAAFPRVGTQFQANEPHCPVATLGAMLFLSHLKGGIAPTVELSVVIGMGIPLLSFPRFHGFRQTNRTSWFAIMFTLTKWYLICEPISDLYHITD